MIKHTPGPWKIGKTSSWSGTEVKAIASVAWCAKASSYSSSWGESQEISADEALANAHLIAAAPDLLATLEKCIEVLEEMDICYVTRLTEKDGEVLLQARAVVAKAKGEG